MRVQFQTHKQLLQLERLLFVLNEIEVNRNLGPEVIEKISNYAMRWFRLGRDAITPDIKLLHHWFALEQLFKLIPERIEGKASSGDKCVLAIATTLSYRHQRRVLGNLWRDIVRLGLLGPDPVFALRESEVTYNDTLRHIIYRQPQNQRLPIAITDDNYYYVTSRTANLPQLILRSHTDGNQTTTILPGSVLYVSENAKVLEGQVITSAFLRAGEESVLVDILGNVQLKVSSFWFFLVSVLFQGHNIEQYISQDNIRRCHQMLSDHVSKYKNQFAYSHGNNLTNEGASVLVTITAVLKLLLERVEAIYHGREIKFLTSIDGRLSAGCGKATQIFILIEELEVLCQEIKSSFASTGLQTKDVTTAWLLENLPETQEIFFKSRQQSIINKLERFAKKRDLLLNILPVYVYLQELSQSIGAEKWRYMALERFRGAKLDPRGDVKRFVVFAPLASDQPLLFSRIKNPSGPDLSSDSLDYYIWQLDRMRRIRNSLVHNAISGSNIEILAIRLQQYTQIYLRLVIGRLATLNEPWVDKKYWTLGFEH